MPDITILTRNYQERGTKNKGETSLIKNIIHLKCERSIIHYVHCTCSQLMSLTSSFVIHYTVYVIHLIR